MADKLEVLFLIVLVFETFLSIVLTIVLFNVIFWHLLTMLYLYLYFVTFLASLPQFCDTYISIYCINTHAQGLDKDVDKVEVIRL